MDVAFFSAIFLRGTKYSKACESDRTDRFNFCHHSCHDQCDGDFCNDAPPAKGSRGGGAKNQ